MTTTNTRNSLKRPREPALNLEVMTITPKLAQEWLDRGGTNRKITRRRIEAMAAAIHEANGS